MKKILILLSAALLLSSGISQAAVPQGGYFLDKNGVPLTEEMQTKPSLKSNPMLPQSGAVHAAMESLPHSSATVIRMTVTEAVSYTHLRAHPPMPLSPKAQDPSFLTNMP